MIVVISVLPDVALVGWYHYGMNVNLAAASSLLISIIGFFAKSYIPRLMIDHHLTSSGYINAGLLSTYILPLIAFVLGVIALRQMSVQPQKGRTLAWIGLVLAGLQLLSIVLVVLLGAAIISR